MSAIPESQHTSAAQIIKWHASKSQQHRPHLGASTIGHLCERYVWLAWRWVLKPEFEGRMIRLFGVGQAAEARFFEELRGIGAEVWDTDPSTGLQWRVSAFNGHFGGSLDAVAKGLPEAPKTAAVVEAKTHNEKSYKDLVNKGVAKAKPQHFDQMQIYMGLMELDRSLYIAECKNTSAVHTEWVHFDRDRFSVLMARASRLIEATEPPLRISTNAEHFECKYCSMWKHCHGGQAAEANCRTCCHSSPVENALWVCGKHSMPMSDKYLSQEEQGKGCDQHLMIPALVPFGDVQDGGDDWVAYKLKETDKYFVNGPHNLKEYGPNFSSKELHMTNGSLIGEVIALKNEFPVSKVLEGKTNPYSDLATAFDDIATHPDDLEAMPDTKADRVKKDKIKKSIKGLEALKP